jgi:hypothetical protein
MRQFLLVLAVFTALCGLASAQTPSSQSLLVPSTLPQGASTPPGNALAGVAPDGASGTGAATGVVDDIFPSPVSTIGYNTFQVSVTGTFVASAGLYGSWDNGAHWSAELQTQYLDSGQCTLSGLGSVGSFILYNPPPLLKLSVTAYTSGNYAATYSLRSNTGASPSTCGNVNSPGFNIPTTSSLASYAAPHAATTTAGSSLVAKASSGNLYGFGCAGVVGGAGHCVAVNSATVPATGTIVPLDVCDLSSTVTSCTLSHVGLGINFNAGITILLTSGNAFTYTTGTDTGFIWADYR